jgi:hypothetical protein
MKLQKKELLVEAAAALRELDILRCSDLLDLIDEGDFDPEDFDEITTFHGAKYQLAIHRSDWPTAENELVVLKELWSFAGHDTAALDKLLGMVRRAIKTKSSEPFNDLMPRNGMMALKLLVDDFATQNDQKYPTSFDQDFLDYLADYEDLFYNTFTEEFELPLCIPEKRVQSGTIVGIGKVIYMPSPDGRSYKIVAGGRDGRVLLDDEDNPLILTEILTEGNADR